ncbi:MAG: branched-chain amino acid ABC transporter permease, partial [Alphaproteobacteria bacterium]|nr:branched-chain amino acid ABC transporter permease [Alphaproteobacteria bacterium]
AYSAFITGIAGGFFTLYLTIVDPTIFDFYYTEAMLIMVLAGGAGSFWPVVAASVVFSAVPEILRMSQELRLILYGGVLVATMLVFPEGLAGLFRRRRVERLRRSLAAAPTTGA